jgi:hypothetical protein
MTPDALFAAIEARQEATFTRSYAMQHFGLHIIPLPPQEAADITSYPKCACGNTAHGPKATYCSECIHEFKNARNRVRRRRERREGRG